MNEEQKPDVTPEKVVAERFFIKVDESHEDGKKRLMLPNLGNIVFEDDDSFFLYYTPNQPYAAMYKMKEFTHIAAWLAEEQKQRDILSSLGGQQYTGITVDISAQVNKMEEAKKGGTNNATKEPDVEK